jgi:hypothetical protein
MPCLLPNLDTPPEARGDRYSLYFSRGTALEADAIAAGLAAAPRVLQVYRARGPGAAAARRLTRALEARGGTSLDLAVAGPDAPGAAQIAESARAGAADTVVLWLAAPDLAGLRGPAPLPVRTYLSSTLLGGELAAARGVAAPDGFVAHPYALPGDVPGRARVASLWLTSHGLVPSDGVEARAQDQTLFALEVLSVGMMHLTKERRFHRDFLLEVLDHAAGLQHYSAYYPRLGFGPGQRYLSKGCHLVPLHGPDAAAEWVVP